MNLSEKHTIRRPDWTRRSRRANNLIDAVRFAHHILRGTPGRNGGSLCSLGLCPTGPAAMEDVAKAHPWALRLANREIAISRFFHFQPLTTVENGGPSLDRIGCRLLRHPSMAEGQAGCSVRFLWRGAEVAG